MSENKENSVAHLVDRFIDGLEREVISVNFIEAVDPGSLWDIKKPYTIHLKANANDEKYLDTLAEFFSEVAMRLYAHIDVRFSNGITVDLKRAEQPFEFINKYHESKAERLKEIRKEIVELEGKLSPVLPKSEIVSSQSAKGNTAFSLTLPHNKASESTAAYKQSILGLAASIRQAIGCRAIDVRENPEIKAKVDVLHRLQRVTITCPEDDAVLRIAMQRLQKKHEVFKKTDLALV